MTHGASPTPAEDVDTVCAAFEATNIALPVSAARAQLIQRLSPPTPPAVHRYSDTTTCTFSSQLPATRPRAPPASRRLPSRPRRRRRREVKKEKGGSDYAPTDQPTPECWLGCPHTTTSSTTFELPATTNGSRPPRHMPPPSRPAPPAPAGAAAAGPAHSPRHRRGLQPHPAGPDFPLLSHTQINCSTLVPGPG
jgi:hypothetical protein